MTRQQLRQIAAAEDVEVLATLLVAMLFGWKAVENNEPEEESDEPAPFGIEDEEIPGLRLVVSEDKEQERFFRSCEYEEDEFGHPVWVDEQIPTWVHNSSRYWTSMTEGTVQLEHELADENRTAAGFYPYRQALFIQVFKDFAVRCNNFHLISTDEG